MAKLGAVLGPWPGTFWLDVAACELVVHEGRDGIAAEVRVPLSAEKMAELLDGLLVEPLPSRPVPPPDPPRPALVSVLEPARRRHGTHPELARARAKRPKTVVCSCLAVVPVLPRGPIPKRCADCRVPIAPPALSKIAEIESARRRGA